MSRCDSAAIVPNTSELLPEPETPVNAVSRRLGISMLTSLRLFTRAPWTGIRSWRSGGCGAAGGGCVVVVVMVAPEVGSGAIVWPGDERELGRSTALAHEADRQRV